MCIVPMTVSVPVCISRRVLVPFGSKQKRPGIKQNRVDFHNESVEYNYDRADCKRSMWNQASTESK
jgi:hypothetical protein